MYTKKLMEHFKNPHNVGELKNPSGRGVVGNPACGDQMEITLRIKDDVITDIKFRTFGCAAAIATSSVLTDLVKGKTIKEALLISKEDIIKELDEVPPLKVHCSILAVEALHKALKDYTDKK